MSLSRFQNKLNELNTALLKYDQLNIPYRTAHNLLRWFIETTEKNYFIFSNKSDPKKDYERMNKHKYSVYWIDFGENIGSEFGGWHYGIVLKEYKYTALIIPLTTKKEGLPDFIDIEGLVDLGFVTGFPDEEKECYACISFLKSMSKKRLNRCGNKSNGFFEIKLTTNQITSIREGVKNILN
ncbi:MAG: type II toxin-antitoxin system PemK/MazF family toxin [Oscillospiraceae bacterium]|nr:type II toxin-antitoxin system PemK/MazF family toxin [Oscillospiraceae bacterium]